MKKKAIRIIALLGMAVSMAGCVFMCAGCQTAIEWEKRPETAIPIQKVVEVNGVQQLATVDYVVVGGGFIVNLRSPLWADEALKGFMAETFTNGAFRVSIDAYNRELSTNAVVMTKTIFDGSANLALAIAKAYATIASGGASDALISKIVNYFKARGGNESKSTVTADGDKITVSDGTTCISCDAAGNCTDCNLTQ